MLKRITKVLFVFMILSLLVGCGKKDSDKDLSSKNGKSILILIYDEDKNNIYEERKETNKEYLLDILSDIKELDLKTEEVSSGVIINSIKGHTRKDTYNWNYYVNGEFSFDSISTYVVKDKDVYEFRLESFEKNE